MSRANAFAVVAATVALTATVSALVDWDAFLSVKSPLEFVLFAAVGWAFAIAGIVAGRIRPHDNTGRLMVLAGLLWLVRGFNFSANPLVFTIGWAFIITYIAALIHVVLGFPLGRLRRPWEKWFVASVYAYYILSATAELTVADPGNVAEGRGQQPINLLLVRDDPELFRAFGIVFQAIDLTIGMVLLGVLARRWWRGTPAYRAAFLPLWITTLVAPVFGLVVYVINIRWPGSLENVGPMVFYAVTAMSPTAVLIGLWRYRVARSAVSDVMVEVGAAPLGEGFTNALRKALRDPDLLLWSWSPDQGSYVDADGVAQVLPDDEDPRAATLLERDGVPVGALVYDRSLRDQPQLIAAVRSAVTVALDNYRLQSELEAQLDEVRQSRGRIVAAGDAQRQRLERDLHDGAQQRLVATAILLRRALRTNNDELLRELVAQSARELDSALVELRELARGVYPPVLAERGLGSALTSLAERSPLPIEIDDGLDDRPPGQIELAAYFIAAEAVTNAAKHSGATLVEVSVRRSNHHLELVVSDDGSGGAKFSPGGGLSGLRDRASALGGDLTIYSQPGKGTAVTVALPW